MKLNIGKQIDDSKFELEIQSAYGSSSEVNVGDQQDRSIRHVRLTEFSDLDMRLLADDLDSIRTAGANRSGFRVEDLSTLQQAASSAKSGNRVETLKLLKTLGTWALNTATEIGAKVAETALKSAFGL